MMRAGAPTAGRAGALLGALLLGVGVTAASAQQEGRARGWLGVGVQELMECRLYGADEDRCWKRLVVTRVVVDGPADRAGVQPGDTLVALDGARLDRGLADPAFAALRPGAVVRMEVSRAGRRTTLRVVPAGRPTGTVAVRVPTPRGETRVIELAGAAPPAVVRPRPGEGGIVIRGEAGGVYRIQPQVEVRAESSEGAAAVLPLEPGRAAEATRRSREALERRLREAAAGGDVVSPEQSRWVHLDPGPELRTLQDSVFRAARARLDSLRRVLGGNEERLRALVDEVRLRRPAPLVWASGFGRSVAGAEFEPLGPELAEFFQGAEDGLLCLRVVAGTPAHGLGLRPGDVVVEAAGAPVASLEDLRDAFRRSGGGALEVKWLRKGQPLRGVLRYD